MGTATVTVNRFDVHGNQRVHQGSCVLSSSYASDGDTITARAFGMSSLDHLELSPASGYVFEPDLTNLKIKAYRQNAGGGVATQAPPLVVEEAVTVASNTGTLAHLPGYIIAVHVTAGSATGAFNVIPTGETPLTKQVAVTCTSGVLTFLSTDAVTAASVTYIPQQPGTMFDADNLVVDEEVTASASKVNLANRALCVQYVWNDTNNVLCALEPSGEAPSATNTAVLDINDSGNSSIDTHADDDGDTLKVTYWKYSAAPSAGVFIDDTDITLSSEAWDFSADAAYDHVVVPGLGTQLVGEATATNQQSTWEGPSGTAAAGVATWNPFTNAILTNESSAMTTTAISWFLLSADFLQQAGEPSALPEVASGVDLSGVTIPFMAHGA